MRAAATAALFAIRTVVKTFFSSELLRPEWLTSRPRLDDAFKQR